MPTKIEKDAVSGTVTTGREWDGVKELDTPLPKWWLYVFYATIAWALVYYVLYPSYPTLSSHFGGVLGYSQRAEFEQRLAADAERRAPFVNRIRAAQLEEIGADRDLLSYAISGGRAIFAENCAPCHGAGGAGRKGYPNLADDDWLWGGDLANIHRTIAFGVRNANDRSRSAQMPRFGADGTLAPAQISDLVELVLALSGAAADATAAERGRTLYVENCAACHGEAGEGNQELGAPRLADRIWLYGGEREQIRRSIFYSRAGSMPAWSGRLDEATIKILAIYVRALGGGQ